MVVCLIIELIFVALIILAGIVLCRALINVEDKLPEQPLTMDALGEELCKYCPLDKSEQGTHGTPNGYTSCEGCRCVDAYERYIEDFFLSDRV